MDKDRGDRISRCDALAGVAASPLAMASPPADHAYPQEMRMRMIVTGFEDGKTRIVREIDVSPHGDGLSTLAALEMPITDLPPRPPGKGEYVNIPVAPGKMGWYRVRFPAGQLRRVHHTDTIDCHTIVSGWIELLLDDGAHRLGPGDSAMVTGVDHGWRVGPEGCVVSMVIFGTPKPG